MQNISVITPLYRGQRYLEQLFSVVENNVACLRQKGSAHPSSPASSA